MACFYRYSGRSMEMASLDAYFRPLAKTCHPAHVSGLWSRLVTAPALGNQSKQSLSHPMRPRPISATSKSRLARPGLLLAIDNGFDSLAGEPVRGTREWMIECLTSEAQTIAEMHCPLHPLCCWASGMAGMPVNRRVLQAPADHSRVRQRPPKAGQAAAPSAASHRPPDCPVREASAEDDGQVVLRVLAFPQTNLAPVCFLVPPAS